MENKLRKWKNVGPNIYLSKKRMLTSIMQNEPLKYGSPQLLVQDSTTTGYSIVYLSIPLMDADKWKKLTKK